MKKAGRKPGWYIAASLSLAIAAQRNLQAMHSSIYILYYSLTSHGVTRQARIFTLFSQTGHKVQQLFGDFQGSPIDLFAAGSNKDKQ